MVTLYVSILHVPFDVLLGLVDGSLELTDNLPEASRVLLGPGHCCWMLLKSDAIYVFYRGISNIPRLSRNRLCSGSRDAGVQRSTAAKVLLLLRGTV